MRPLLMMLLVAASLPAAAVPKGMDEPLPAPMHDARFELRIDSAPARMAERFAIDGSVAPTSPKAAARDRFTLSLSTHGKGAGTCGAVAAVFKNGFEN